MKRAGRNVCKCTVGFRTECGITSSGTKRTGGRDAERNDLV